jgi:hypothetical protein
MHNPTRLWPSWYRGDFHAHTNHSDGSLTPPQLLAEARTRQLDFFSSTDHNIISAHDQFGDHADMLIIPGVEVTMAYGHFNVFGMTERPDWFDSLPTTKEAYTLHMRTGETRYTPTELMKITRDAGLYNSINHPLLVPWAWLDRATDLRLVDFLEIWNDPSWPENAAANPQAVAMWTRWLNAGYRITAIGGTDFHHARAKVQPDGSIVEADRLNKPTTYVFATELSGNAIMAALKQRRAYMTMGPEVAFGMTVGDKTAMVGDDVADTAGVATLQTTVHGTGVLTAQLVRNGEIVCEASGQDGVRLQLTTQLDGETSAWFRIDVRDENGRYLAVTNPIFSGAMIVPTDHRYGAFLAE